MRTQQEQTVDTRQPLAARVRPKTLDQYIGQEKVVGPGTVLRKMIEAKKVGSLILWGPPGVGKTTLAYLIADQMQANVERVSAVTAGVKDLREIITQARKRQSEGVETVLIIDEIHRFNKAQQDVLLPVVEEGVVTMIGATTENPYFEVISALVSRVQVIRLEHHTDEALRAIARQALQSEQGFAGKKVLLAEAEEALTKLAAGDARRLLTILDQAVLITSGTGIRKNDIEAAAQRTVIQYDKKGDVHYDTISAFIKSMRGSDADAALFYLFRMLKSGEDPLFIMRRMLIFASEDVGNADPHALMLAISAAQTLERVGLPEAEFALAQAATYLAAAPKSNSVYIAKERAKVDVEQFGNEAPPAAITHAPIKDLQQFGKGVGYAYPHDFPGHVVAQQYRPSVIQKNLYYEPTEEGFEKEINQRIDRARQIIYGEG